MGVQFSGRAAVSTDVVTPFARVTWEHEFHTARGLDASFAAAAGFDFTVYGASAVQDAARVNADLKVAVARHVEVSASFDGDVSGRSDSHGGNGGLRIIW